MATATADIGHATSSTSAASGSSPPATSTIDVVNAVHRGGHGRDPARARRRTSTAPSRPRAPRSTAWSQTPRRGARRAAAPRSPTALGGARRRDRRADRRASSACRSSCRRSIQAGLPTDDLRLDGRSSSSEVAVGGAGRQLAGRARAGRRRRRDHAVELPAAPDRREGRAGAGRRLHGRAQAERGRAAERVRPRRDHRRGRPAGRRLQPRHRASGPVVGEAIAAHPGVDMVSFTGSTRAGRRVSELRRADGQARRARARRQVAPT